MDIYIKLKTQALGEYNQLSSNVFSSKVVGLSLEEYCIVWQRHCELNHNSKSCTEYPAMIKAAQIVFDKEIVPMAQVFRTAFTSVTYHSLNANRRLLQFLLVAFRVGNTNSSNNELSMMEKIEGVDYEASGCFLTQCTTKPLKQNMTKEDVKELFKLTQNERKS